MDSNFSRAAASATRHFETSNFNSSASFRLKNQPNDYSCLTKTSSFNPVSSHLLGFRLEKLTVVQYSMREVSFQSNVKKDYY